MLNWRWERANDIVRVHVCIKNISFSFFSSCASYGQEKCTWAKGRMKSEWKIWMFCRFDGCDRHYSMLLRMNAKKSECLRCLERTATKAKTPSTEPKWRKTSWWWRQQIMSKKSDIECSIARSTPLFLPALRFQPSWVRKKNINRKDKTNNK